MRGVGAGRRRGPEVAERTRVGLEQQDAAHRADRRGSLKIEVDLVGPTGVGARERGPAGLVDLGEAGVARGAREPGELAHGAVRHRGQLRALPVPVGGQVCVGVRVVVRVDDGDNARWIALPDNAVGGPNAHRRERDGGGRPGPVAKVGRGRCVVRRAVPVQDAGDARARRLSPGRRAADVRVPMTPAVAGRRVGQSGSGWRHKKRDHRRDGDDRPIPPAERLERHVTSPP